jgi:hypothetical protein
MAHGLMLGALRPDSVRHANTTLMESAFVAMVLVGVTTMATALLMLV